MYVNTGVYPKRVLISQNIHPVYKALSLYCDWQSKFASFKDDNEERPQSGYR